MIADIEIRVEKLATGDIKAFESIYLDFNKRIFAFCLKHGQNIHDAQEVVQEVFIKLWNSRQGIDPSKNFESYLISIAKNVMIDKFRKLAREIAAKKHHIYTLQPINDTENRIIYNELNDTIQSIIQTLPKVRRLVFHMSRVKGYSNREIATELGVSVRTVENHISKALEVFHEKLGHSRAISITAILIIYGFLIGT